MFPFLTKMALRSAIRKNNLAQKKQFLPWEKVEKIALIISNNDKLNKSALDKFIDGSKKFVEVFYVELSSKQPAYADWQCFTKKDASLLQLPKSKVTESLKTKKFDLVINTAGETDLFSIALCSALQAPFKCSSSEKFNEAPLIIQRATSYTLVDYLTETLRYFKMIRV